MGKRILPGKDGRLSDKLEVKSSALSDTSEAPSLGKFLNDFSTLFVL